MTDNRATVTLRALEQLGTVSLREHDMDTLLQRVVDLTKLLMPFEAEASVLLVAGRRPTTPASTGALATDCDVRQVETGQGPCLHAAGSGEITEVPDTRTDPRWRDYMDGAAERGALSSLSLPLPIAEDTVGALNIYARQARAFDAEARETIARFAPRATVAVANMHAYQDARNRADNLQVALQSRAVIDQAKGIVMAVHRVTAEEAFAMLVDRSQRENVKLRDLAERFIDDIIATDG